MMSRNRQHKGLFELIAFVAFLPVFATLWVVDRVVEALDNN